MYDSLTKEILARAITDTVLHMLEINNFDFSEIIDSEASVIANEVHCVLNKYGFCSEHGYDEQSDFNAIEDIIHIFEEHGCSIGTIHDFD